MKLHNKIFLGIGLGIFWGIIAKTFFGGEIYIGFLGSIFVQTLKMLIAPLIFASIVMGVAGLGDTGHLGKMGYRTIFYYLTTTLLAVFTGLLLVNMIRPGEGADVEALRVKLETARGVPQKLFEAGGDRLSDGETAQAFLIFQSYTDRYPEADKVELARSRMTELSTKYPELARSHELARGKLQVDHLIKKLTGLTTPPATIGDFMRAQIDKSLKNPFEALARSEVLAIIIFALLLGMALTTLGDEGKPLVSFFNALNHAMMRITEWVMHLAPFGVVALMAEAVSTLGLEVLKLLAWYMVTVIIGLAIHGLFLLPLILRLVGKMSLGEFLTGMRPALAIAFSTSSSSATLPVTMECTTDNLKVSEKVSGFVLPLGATVNMDGTALYEAVAAIFIAQTFGVELSALQQLLVVLTATLAAIGAAGIPSAGTVTMAMVLTAVNLPLEGIGMILAVDRPLDMLRTTVNVIGDGMGCVIIDRLEQDDAAKAEQTAV